MTVKIEVYDSYCGLSLFEINDIEANYNDFGDKVDKEADCAEDYCCGNMMFEPKPVSKEVLEKYNITPEEYNQICEKLDCLSFGCCGLCE